MDSVPRVPRYCQIVKPLTPPNWKASSKMTLIATISSTARRGAPDRVASRASGEDGAPSRDSAYSSREPAIASLTAAPNALKAAPTRITSRTAPFRYDPDSWNSGPLDEANAAAPALLAPKPSDCTAMQAT